MTIEQALDTLGNAEEYLWSFIQPKHFLEEYPVEQKAIETLQSLQRDLRRILRAGK